MPFWYQSYQISKQTKMWLYAITCIRTRKFRELKTVLTEFVDGTKTPLCSRSTCSSVAEATLTAAISYKASQTGWVNFAHSSSNRSWILPDKGVKYVFNRLCGSIGHYVSYSMDGKKFFVLVFPFFVQIDMAVLLKRHNWKLLPKVNLIYVYLIFHLHFEVVCFAESSVKNFQYLDLFVFWKK